MFTVKATYRNETRRFTFPEFVLFPTYEELHQQLYRIFPISRNYYLSRLIFSPDASKPGRILVGKEVHSAEDYDARVAPLRRLWPNPLLRFTIFDGTAHETPSGTLQRLSMYSLPPSELSKPSVEPDHDDARLPPTPHSCAPPSSTPQPFVSRVLPPSPPCKMTPPLPPPICFSTPSHPWSSHEGGTVGTAPCCSVTRGKVDIQILLSSFKDDLERILCRTLGSDCVEKSSDPDVERSVRRVPEVDPILPQTETSSVGASASVSSRWCFVCKTSFTGVWYGCVKCPWHAVCPGCFSKSHSAHTLSFGPSHVVQRHAFGDPTQASAQIVQENDVRCSRSGNSQLRSSAPSGPTGEPPLTVHYGVLCDSCDQTVVGIRHKCLDCPDYDLCTGCVESGATEQHNPFHEFFDIETPGRVYVHTVFDGSKDRSVGNAQQVSCPDRPPAPRQGPVDLPARHSATCNLCDSAIVGVRYKCVVCPDFDTCSSCFRITTEQHPYHGFVKVNKPEDLMMCDGTGIPPRPVSHLAICDSCQKTIRGARYKCMHPSCPDFDLCTDCEALPIPVHPLNHPLLKLKTSDTVIPTVYRTPIVHESATPSSPPARSESRSPVLATSLVTIMKSPEPKPIAVSSQVANMTSEDQIPSGEEFLSPLGSPASQVIGVAPTSLTTVPSHLLVDVADPPASPQSIHPALDIYHQLWPRVNQEIIHLNAMEAPQVGDTAANPAADAIMEPIGPKSVAAEELHSESPVPFLAQPASEHRRTYPVSPVPSTRSIVDGYRTPSSTLSKDRESHYVAQHPSAGDQQQTVIMDVPPRRSLDAVLVGDANVPDGQIFPPGAEFVKGWHMRNNGGWPWPINTEVQFVAGEMFTPERSAALRAKVGVVHPGQGLDIWTGDLKAPDVPGRYVGYWRLSDGQGSFFGSSVWIDLTVADHRTDQASEESLASSSMVMPSPHPTNLINTSDELHDASQPSLSSTKTVTDEVEESGSEIASLFLVSVPTSDDEDAEWQDTRTHSEPLEYVVLYDSNSEE